MSFLAMTWQQLLHCAALTEILAAWLNAASGSSHGGVLLWFVVFSQCFALSQCVVLRPILHRRNGEVPSAWRRRSAYWP